MTGLIEDAPPLPGWLRRGMPFERRRVRVHGDLITFVDHGPRNGRPVLLVHGNPTWSFLWRKVITALDGSPLRVIAPDLLGFGTSDKPPRASDHQLGVHIEVVSALANMLELDGFLAVGQDWGGPIACGVAERHPSRVGGLVLGNTAVLEPARPFRSKGFHKLSHLPILSDALFRGLLFPIPVMNLAQGDRASIGLRERIAYGWPFAKVLDRSGPLGLARMVPDSEHHPSTAVLDRVGRFVRSWRGPAALVWARRDPILGRGLRRHAEALPQATVRECDAGHFSQEEVPELWADAIREVADAADAALA